jgi:hypothetical protein
METVPMDRRELLAIAALASAYTVTSQAAESPSRDADPWVGTYLKYSKYDTKRVGQFGEAQTITISKDRDGYALSEPYADAHFRERTKSVLSDRPGGLGKIFFGSVDYADGKKVSVLRAEFCYENFVLYRETEATGASKVQAPTESKSVEG